MQPVGAFATSVPHTRRVHDGIGVIGRDDRVVIAACGHRNHHVPRGERTEIVRQGGDVVVRLQQDQAATRAERGRGRFDAVGQGKVAQLLLGGVRRHPITMGA